MGRKKKNSGVNELASGYVSTNKDNTNAQKKIVGADYTEGNGTVTQMVEPEISRPEATTPVDAGALKPIKLVEEARNNNWKEFTQRKI